MLFSSLFSPSPHTPLSEFTYSTACPFPQPPVGVTAEQPGEREAQLRSPLKWRRANSHSLWRWLEPGSLLHSRRRSPLKPTLNEYSLPYWFPRSLVWCGPVPKYPGIAAQVEPLLKPYLTACEVDLCNRYQWASSSKPQPCILEFLWLPFLLPQWITAPLWMLAAWTPGLLYDFHCSVGCDLPKTAWVSGKHVHGIQWIYSKVGATLAGL